MLRGTDTLSPLHFYRPLMQLAHVLHCMEASVSMRCRLLQLFLRRNCMRRHDYLHQLHKIIAVYASLSVLSTLRLNSDLSWISRQFWACIPTAHYRIYSNGSMSASRDSLAPYVGGGSSTFTFNDLEPYFVNDT